MQAFWLLGWLWASFFGWEDVAAANPDPAYVYADEGLVQAQDGNTGGGPP